MLQGGCSDDGFWEFRNGLIGLGREAYEAITRDPDSIVDWFEDEDDYYDQTELAELSYDLQDVWRELSGADPDSFMEHGLTLRSTPTGTRRDDEADEVASLRASVPRAVAKYWDEDGEGDDDDEDDEGDA